MRESLDNSRDANLPTDFSINHLILAGGLHTILTIVVSAAGLFKRLR